MTTARDLDATEPAVAADPWDEIRGVYGANWLAEQLPGILAADPLLQNFLAIFQDVADTVRWPADHIEYYVDPTIAPMECVRWLARWFTLELETSWDEARQRDFVGAIGPLFRHRHTRAALTQQLRAATGGPVRVVETGQVRTSTRPPRPGEVPAASAVAPVAVTVAQTGGHSVETLEGLIRLLVPANCRTRLTVDPDLEAPTEEAQP